MFEAAPFFATSANSSALPAPSPLLDAARRRLGAQQLQRVLDRIEAALGSELRLVELATVAGLSVSHFATLFRLTTGMSVHQYVMQQRVQRAQQLLLRGGMSVCEVALETGFAHQSHLARWMRRLHGKTPGTLLREADPCVAADAAATLLIRPA